MTTNKRKQAASQSLLFIVIGTGILIALNVLGLFTPYGRFDATRNGLFSLAPSSIQLMEDLDEEMTITAYFSSDLPPQFASTEHEVRDLLEEYAQASNGHLSVRVIDPGDDEELRTQAADDGVEEVVLDRAGPVCLVEVGRHPRDVFAEVVLEDGDLLAELGGGGLHAGTEGSLSSPGGARTCRKRRPRGCSRAPSAGARRCRCSARGNSCRGR